FLAKRASKAALALFEVANRRLPDSEKIEYGLALAYQLQGNYAESVEILYRLLRKNPRFAAAYKVLDENCEDAQMWDKLLENILHLKEADSGNSWIWYLEAKARFQLRDTTGL